MLFPPARNSTCRGLASSVRQEPHSRLTTVHAHTLSQQSQSRGQSLPQKQGGKDGLDVSPSTGDMTVPVENSKESSGPWSVFLEVQLGCSLGAPETSPPSSLHLHCKPGTGASPKSRISGAPPSPPPKSGSACEQPGWAFRGLPLTSLSFLCANTEHKEAARPDGIYRGRRCSRVSGKRCPAGRLWWGAAAGSTLCSAVTALMSSGFLTLCK